MQLKTSGITVILALSLMVLGCGNKDTRRSFKDAVSYNDYVIDRINTVEKRYASVLSQSESQEEGLVACKELAELCEVTMNKLNHIQPFKEDSSFCESAKKFTLYMKSIAGRELPQFFKLIYDDNRTDEQQPEIDRRAHFLDEQYDAQIAYLKQVQQTLSKKFHFEVTK